MNHHLSSCSKRSCTFNVSGPQALADLESIYWDQHIGRSNILVYDDLKKSAHNLPFSIPVDDPLSYPP
jgi:hypothetical protein